MFDESSAEVLDITPQMKPYVISGAKYRLYEANGDAVVKWRNGAINSTKFNANTGKPEKFTNIADQEPFLVSLCLKRVNDNNGEEDVAVTTIKSWPARVQKEMYAWVRKNSGLEEAPTPNQLRKQIVELEEQIRVMEEEGGNDPKALPSVKPLSIEDGSDSANTSG